VRITFNEVAVRATRRWTENGKKRQQTRKFFQTINPFNKGANGLPKDRDQIMREITAKRDAWLRGENVDG
jgi:hypothetical protein